MNRRSLLTTVAAIPAAVFLASCGTTVSQVTSDVEAISTGLNGIMPDVATIPGIAASTVAALRGYLTDLNALATKIAANATPTASVIEQVASDVRAFADLALPLIPGGAVYLVAINAALALLPSLLAAVGVSGASPSKDAMTPAQARAVLSTFAR